MTLAVQPPLHSCALMPTRFAARVFAAMLFLGTAVQAVAAPVSPRAITRAEAAEALEHVYRGHPHAALEYLDALEPQCGGTPLYLLIRARALQEFIPMDDFDTDVSRKLSEPALGAFDEAIELCNAKLEAGADPVYLLYRGWAWMAKSYTRSMTRHMWPAAREAKRGQSDLEAYLEVFPDDPTANGLMGAFLYFADIVPSVFKWISRLLPFVPSGDREEGLARLKVAVNGDALMTVDYALILYNVYFYFEGRFTDGLAGLREMNERYPAYTRTAIPLAVAKPYVPTAVADLDARVDATIQAVYGGPNREVDWNALYLLQAFRAYSDRYLGRPRAAAVHLRSIVHESPAHPDWIATFARLELGGMLAAQGQEADARAMLDWIRRRGTDALRDDADDIMDDMDDYVATPLPETDWVGGVYRSGPDSVAAYRERFARLSLKSIPATFYLAECMLLQGDFAAASEAYQRVIEADAPAWERTYQMLAATRAAEIHAATGDYHIAAEHMDAALDFLRKEYLVDWVLEGRKRYFERLADGEEQVEPTLLDGLPNKPAARTGPDMEGGNR